MYLYNLNTFNLILFLKVVVFNNLINNSIKSQTILTKILFLNCFTNRYFQKERNIERILMKVDINLIKG